MVALEKPPRASDSGLNTYFMDCAQQVFAARAQTYQMIIRGRRCLRLARRTRALLRENRARRVIERVYRIKRTMGWLVGISQRYRYIHFYTRETLESINISSCKMHAKNLKDKGFKICIVNYI